MSLEARADRGTDVKPFDYIVVGAGSAGCVLADRLTRDGRTRVLLIEAGPEDTHPFIHMPKGIARIIGNPAFTWGFTTNPAQGNNNTAEYWARGRTLGGSSAINGMMYVRGQPADFEEFAQQTSDDWGWEKIGAAYRELESHELGGAETRGVDGPLHVTMPTMRDRLTKMMIDAGQSMGLRLKADVNAPEGDDGVGFAPRTVHKGRRESAATAFLRPARKRPNLTIVTETLVDRLIVEEGRAVGITGTRRGAAISHRAREVILCGGALASPAILQRSGIGDRKHLASLGIPLVHHSPNVGRNLREHRALVMQWRTDDELSQNREHRGWRLMKNVVRYYLTRGGLLTAATYEAGAWFRTAPGLNRPDGQFLLAPFSFDFSRPTMDVEREGGFHICAYILRPESTGSVMITSADPSVFPAIEPNYAATEGDRRKMVDLVRYARRYVAQEPLASVVKGETRPGPDFQTDEEILAAYEQMGNGAYHASGSCRMGSDPDSVVDPLMRIRGVPGVRVVDASIFPFIPAGNTMAPVMATAWRGADLILSART